MIILVTRLCLVRHIRRLCLDCRSRGRASGHRLPGRAWEPVKLYPFNRRESIPHFLLPLQSGDEEPVVNLSEVLGEVYQEAALDLAIDYSVQSIPALSEGDFQWVRSLMES
ncbi:DUF4058 family protein [Microcoleus sp. AR_TQ3_B6]|uniref:DUF4058 family protein n=1 Tax=Microcoleus sp. AR_TQ3_B6 TaxID=3055284 RepID=UPI002FD0FB1D